MSILKLLPLMILIFLPNNSISQNKSKELDEKTLLQVWKMIKAFGEKNKLQKNYIFYFENLSWAKAIRRFIKGRNSNDGLFGFDVKPSTPRKTRIKPKGMSWFSSSRITLHVADLWSLRALDEQIREGNNSTFNGFKNYFLINIPSNMANDTGKIAKLFADSPLSYNSLTFAFFITNHTYENGEQYQTIEIYDVYKINSNSKDVEVQRYGSWSAERSGYGELGQSLLVEDEVMWKRRGNLKGYHIRAAAAYYPNFCTHIEDNCTDPSCFTGISGRVWKTLTENLNFTYTIRKESSWGSMLNESGIVTWTGMIGMLTNDEIDIAAADFTITSDRSQVVDFLPVLIESFIQIFIANPTDKQNWMAFIEPVTWQAWLGVLAFLIIAPPIICCVFYYGKEPVQDELKLSDCYCLAYKTLLMQGWSKTPDSYQNRIAFVCVMIAGMLLYWHWEAMVISYLAVKKTVLPYESFEQLLSSSSDKVLTKKGTVYGDLFRYAKDDTLQKVWKERMEAEFDTYPTTDEGMLEYVTAKSGYAAFDSSSGWMTRPAYLRCEVIDLPIAYSEQLTYAMQKNSPFYWLFHHNINKMKEGGTFQQIVNSYSGESQNCPDTSGLPLNMNQCFTAFVILLIGGGLGLLFLLIEKFVPSKWVKAAWSLGDRSFERCLEKIYHPNSLKPSLCKDGSSYYDINRELRAQSRFFNELEAMSRSTLIEEIKSHIQQKKNLIKRIEDLEKIIISQEKSTKDKISSNQEVDRNKQIMSKQFDEAFDITSHSNKLNKTYSRQVLFSDE